MTGSVLDEIANRLTAAGEYDRNVQVAPVAVLWPDESRQWSSAIKRIEARLPVISLGDYDVEARSGPAYWIRCVVAGTIDLALPAGTPIVYLPGIGKASLRGTDDCAPGVAPIAELQFRSQWFAHPKGRDWSVPALLSNQARGLGLRVADDEATRKMLGVALPQLLDEPIERLERQVLDADYLHDLIDPDPEVSVLQWLDDPISFRGRAAADHWTAFVQRCKRDFGFDPERSSEIEAARMLGLREGIWGRTWKRFAEVPDRFSGVVGQLRRARPDELIVDEGVWPQDNEQQEDFLRKRLGEFPALAPDAAREELHRLEEDHSARRSSVWAELEQAPLAFALEQLCRLAELTASPLAEGDLDAHLSDYRERGRFADDALVRALEAVEADRDRAAVAAAIAAVYRTWVDAGARALQRMCAEGNQAEAYEATVSAPPVAGTVILFVDGLRLDLGHRLREWLEGAGMEASVTAGLAALPTVTQTAKAALVPVARGALGPGSDLNAAETASGTDATIAVLRRLLEANGVQVLTRGEVGDPSRPAFAEAGDIDGRGHDQGIQMVDGFAPELRRIVTRVRELFEGGWRRVEVVTDHGWLLMPGGMEKVDLPPATASQKKGRCARLKEGARVEVPTVPWRWDPTVRIAIAPGATCFEANKEYEHGGVSSQECVVPRIEVRPGRSSSEIAEFTTVKWLGLQCRVEFQGLDRKATVDIRLQSGDAASSITERAKETASSGRASLLIPEEDLEGRKAHLVLVAADGRILAQRDVVVGENR